jgi:hypothetical protein
MAFCTEQRFEEICASAVSSSIKAWYGTLESPKVGPYYGLGMCLLILPSGKVTTISESPSLLSFFVSPGGTPPAACPPELVDDIKSVALSVAEGCQRHEKATQFKVSLGAALQEITSYRYKPLLTAQAVDGAALGHPSPVMELSHDLWIHIASFLPMSDLLAFPAVGGQFYTHRDEFTWGTLYRRFFGTFTPAELDIDQERWTVEYYKKVAKESLVEEESYWRDFKMVMRPLLSSSRLATLTPSAGLFFDRVAPKGVIKLGAVSLNVIHTAPMRLIHFRTHCSVQVEEVHTCRGALRLLFILVPTAPIPRGPGSMQSVCPVYGGRSIARLIAAGVLAATQQPSSNSGES